MNKKFGLGKGLDALIQDYSANASINEISLDLIKESPYQPRFLITEESLSELISSIRENGIIEPLVVRKIDDRYELIAGHRRLSALKFLKKETAPVYIIDVQDQKAAELTIVENIQRVDLNPVELAKSISQMLQRFSLTHEQVSKVLGKSRVYITNILRLLSLDADTIKALETQQISEGHGRLLLQITDISQRTKLLSIILDKQWSVKQLSDYIKKLSETKEKREISVFLTKETRKQYEHTMSTFFNTPVKIKGKKIEIVFKEEKEFLGFFNTFNSLITNSK
ncbi:MAG TPA: ParB/RepB/Spo0J family partition protein [Caldisericia bacterium]|mgnify:CR=1 FL=1|nr:ParB/RepB/Spo0J family partition protein [Caldisericia bacterium]